MRHEKLVLPVHEYQNIPCNKAWRTSQVPIAWLARVLLEVPYLTTLEVVEQSLGVSSPEPVFPPKAKVQLSGVYEILSRKGQSVHTKAEPVAHSANMAPSPVGGAALSRSMTSHTGLRQKSMQRETGLTGWDEVHLRGLSTRGGGAGKAGIVQKQRRSGGLHSKIVRNRDPALHTVEGPQTAWFGG